MENLDKKNLSDREHFVTEYALASNPENSQDIPQISVAPGANDSMTPTFEIQTAATDVTITPQFSNDLEAWSTKGILLSRTPLGNGIDTITDRFNFTEPKPLRFTRLLVQLQ